MQNFPFKHNDKFTTHTNQNSTFLNYFEKLQGYPFFTRGFFRYLFFFLRSLGFKILTKILIMSGSNSRLHTIYTKVLLCTYSIQFNCLVLYCICSNQRSKDIMECYCPHSSVIGESGVNKVHLMNWLQGKILLKVINKSQRFISCFCLFPFIFQVHDLEITWLGIIIRPWCI